LSRLKAHGPVRLSSRAAVERLCSAFPDEFSPLTGASAFIIELDDGPPPAHAEIATAIARLRTLGCASIGVGDASPWTTTGTAGGLVRALDVIVPEEDLLAVLAAIDGSPLAATVLVQLLRLGERLDVYEALVAESLAYSTLQSGPEFRAWLAARRPAAVAAVPTPGPPVVGIRNGKRLEVVLNRPERRNAYSAEMRDALAELLELARADSSIEEIVLRGSGPSFSSGGDLAEFGMLPDPATAHAVRTTRSVARLLADCADRVRVEVHGACVGAGVELPAFARHVVAREDAFFQLPEVSMGLVPGAGGTASIPRRIGRQRTAQLALAGLAIDARTALAWGLVDEIGPGK